MYARSLGVFFSNIFWSFMWAAQKKDNLGWFSLWRFYFPWGEIPKLQPMKLESQLYRISFIKLFCRKFLMSGNRPWSIFSFGRFFVVFPKFLAPPHIPPQRERAASPLTADQSSLPNSNWDKVRVKAQQNISIGRDFLGKFSRNSPELTGIFDIFRRW